MKQTGFTLVELMITITIIGILAFIAYPSYVRYFTKTHRAEAMSLLLQDAAFMERFYTENGCYRNKGADKVCGTDDDSNPTLTYTQSPTSGSTIFYTISLDASSTSNGSSFLLTATPKSGSSQANDGDLTLNSSGEKGWTKNPSGNLQSWQ